MMQVNTIVFDWGDTLMKVFPQYSGVMADWPEVGAVENARETLAALHGKYRLVVGSNAANSDAGQIMDALNRVGLAEFIDQVFTFSEIGYRKPDENFYWQIERLLGEERHHLVMVGDEYRADVLGAVRAGWRAVWYNPRCVEAAGLWPLQTAEIQDLAVLPDVVEHLDLPSTTTALTWLQESELSTNLLMHVQMVAALAYILAVYLRRNGEKVDPVLAHRGGLLHDLAKLSARKLTDGTDHGQAAARWLRQQGQAELAEIANRHMLFCIHDPARAPRSWEEKLVYFADKLVEGGGVASIETRLAALKARYRIDEDKINATEASLVEMRAMIADQLGWPVDEFTERLKQALWVK